MTGSSQMSAASAGIDSSSIKLDEEAMDILQEATSLLEENTRDKFPDLPLSKDRVVSSTKATNFLDS
jgi:division protein CdvB (Snf7/Vps24/ESCRT-III family)